MHIHYGYKYDFCEREASEFLQINSCGFQTALKDYIVIRERGRSDYHLILVESGVCEVVYDGRTYALKKGEAVLYPPNMPHYYKTVEAGDTLWCHFTGTAIEEVLSEYGISGGIKDKRGSHEFFESFSTMIRRYHQPKLKPLANAALLETLYYFSDNLKDGEKASAKTLISGVISFMHQNYSKAITVEALAKNYGYSAGRFSHIFSQVTGTSPMRYLNEIRLRAAAELLATTSYPISEIASVCGFAAPLYFSRCFKKKYEVSPSEYRAVHKYTE